MVQENKKRTQKKGRKRKSGHFSLSRLFVIAALFLVLIVSVCTVGYVIFFRTVFAQEILPALRSAIVFEEPNPPVQLPVEPTEEPASMVPTGTIEPLADRPGEQLHSIAKEVPAQQPVLPKVAIIIDDMGYDETTGQQLLKLPFELTYSFLPFAPHTRKLENIAHSTGKTIFLHLPLQPKGNAYSPGPGALYLLDLPEEQRAKLQQCLQEVPRAIGINNHMGSSFTEDEQAMTNIVREMKDRSLIFVDSYTSPDSVALQVAQAASIKSARRNVFLDNIQDEQKICSQLEKLVQIAEKKGWAIGIAHPYRATVNALTMCGEKYLERVEYVGVPEVLAGEVIGKDHDTVRPAPILEQGVGILLRSP